MRDAGDAIAAAVRFVSAAWQMRSLPIRARGGRIDLEDAGVGFSKESFLELARVAEKRGGQAVPRPIAQGQRVFEILGPLHHQERAHGLLLNQRMICSITADDGWLRISAGVHPGLLSASCMHGVHGMDVLV